MDISKVLYMMTLLLLLGLEPSPGQNLDQFGFMKKLFKKCNNPANFIETRTPILAKGIPPTRTISKLQIFFKTIILSPDSNTNSVAPKNTYLNILKIKF